MKHVVGGFLFCLDQCRSRTKFNMFSYTEIFVRWRQALSCHQHGFLRSAENVLLNNFQNLRCIGVGMSCNTFYTNVLDGKPLM